MKTLLLLVALNPFNVSFKLDKSITPIESAIASHLIKTFNQLELTELSEKNSLFIVNGKKGNLYFMKTLDTLGMKRYMGLIEYDGKSYNMIITYVLDNNIVYIQAELNN